MSAVKYGLIAGAALLGWMSRPKRAAAAWKGPQPKNWGVPFAQGSSSPMWPIDQESYEKRKNEVPYMTASGDVIGNGSRRFHADRGGTRWHVGCDLYANVGDCVLAPENGHVVATQSFKAGTHAVLIQNDSGLVVLLGEVEVGSWKKLGIQIGSRVYRGQCVAWVGAQDGGGAHMLHFETYTAGTTENAPWYKGEKPPTNLRDPTLYLLQAQMSVVRLG